MSDSEVEIPVAAPVKQKVKMPRSAAQMAATQRGLEALARRRAEMSAARTETAPAAAAAAAPKRVIKAPEPDAVSPDMMEKAMALARAEVAKAPAASSAGAAIAHPRSGRDAAPVAKVPKAPAASSAGAAIAHPRSGRDAPKAETAPAAKPKRKTRTIVIEDSSSSEEEPIFIKRTKPIFSRGPAPPPVPPTQPTISGSDLLDKIFFSR